MKASSRIFGIIGVFFFIVATAYLFVSILNRPLGVEWIGTLTLYGAGGLGFMIAIATGIAAKNHTDRPEDDLHGDVDTNAGPQGSFAPYSWWPLWAAIGAALVFLGVAAGWWILAIGVIPAVYGVIGWVMEFSRGEHAH